MISLREVDVGTLFEIDNKIVDSRNPNTTISELVGRYKNSLITARMNGAWISNAKMEEYAAAYKSILNGYKERMKLVNQSFKNNVK